MTDNNKFEECIICYDDLNEENRVQYIDKKGGSLKKCKMCKECVLDYQNKQWESYQKSISEEKCKKALKNIIEKGPPINIRDQNCFPCENENGEVYKLYYSGKFHSAKLVGSLTGEKRMNYWKELKKFI